MAEITQNTSKGSRRKTVMPRIDFTPMVDLGFLLITFFIYTTTMTESKAMDINMPYNHPTKEPTVFIDTSTITIIPTKDHKIAYYTGALESDAELKMTDHARIREVIISKQSDLKKLPNTFSAEAHKLHVIIKPNDDSKYEDLVKILDEMLINAVPYYAIVDISREEQIALSKYTHH